MSFFVFCTPILTYTVSKYKCLTIYLIICIKYLTGTSLQKLVSESNPIYPDHAKPLHEAGLTPSKFPTMLELWRYKDLKSGYLHIELLKHKQKE